MKNGMKGFFPKTYTAEFSLESIQARALYEYEGSSPDEMTLSEGQILTIVDRSDTDWWKCIRGDTIAMVPASYVQAI